MKLFDLKPRRTRKRPNKQQDLGQAPMAIPNLIQGIIIDAFPLIKKKFSNFFFRFGRKAEGN